MKCCRCHLHCRRRRPARGLNPGKDNGVVFDGGGAAAAAAAPANYLDSRDLEKVMSRFVFSIVPLNRGKEAICTRGAGAELAVSHATRAWT